MLISHSFATSSARICPRSHCFTKLPKLSGTFIIGRPNITPLSFAAFMPSSCRFRIFTLSFSATKDSTCKTKSAMNVPRNFTTKNEMLTFKLICLWNRWTDEHGVVERKKFTLDNAVDFFHFNYGIKNLLELIYRRNLQSTVYDAFYEVMMPQYGTNAFECYESRFYSYALFGLLDEWVKRGFYESVEQMVENVNRICGRHQ